MATVPAELPRPGVEVIQEFQSAAPTIVRPTLVPFVCGPAKEIVEVTNSDGTLNSAAKQGSYTQLPKVISQTSFPSPRNNIAEVEIDNDYTRLFFQFGGSLRELERTPGGESFLVAANYAARPSLRSLPVTTATGFALDQKVLVLALDITARLNTTKDITVTFAGATPGANLTPQQVCDQINAAVGSTVADVITLGSQSRVEIASLKYGASASVTVRAGGSANSVLGFATGETRVEGAGFRAQDQSNNTTLSPWIEWTPGAYLLDGTSSALPAYSDSGSVTNTSGAGFLDSTGTFGAALVQSSMIFTGSNSLDLKVGDEFWADGAQPAGGAVIMKVESSRFKLGTVNATLSTVDANGNIVSAVYDVANTNTILSSTPFAPTNAWFMAKNLVVGTTAVAAVLTGTEQGVAATTATATAASVPAGSAPYALAGLTLIVGVTVDGVTSDDFTFTFTGGPFADLTALVSAIGTTIPGVFAHTDTGGTKLALSTSKTGAQQSLVIRSTSTALAALGFATGADISATGTDVSFVNDTATVTGTVNPTLVGLNSKVLEVTISTDGGNTYTNYTHTFTADPADLPSLVSALTADSAFAAGVTAAPSGTKLALSSVATGGQVSITIKNDAPGNTAATALGFTLGQTDSAEAQATAEMLKFQLNGRPHIYQVTFTSNSLVDAVAAINEVVGWPVASIGGTNSNSLVLTSPLKGYASSVTIVADSTTESTNKTFGFNAGNQTATGTGRPNPDFYLDVSGNINIGAEILRSAVTGAPFDPGTCDVYVQYRGLRLDLSPAATNPSLLRISDVATLQTVLSPITADNPLGLGMFFELINAPGLECAGMGVDDAPAAAPDGTLAAYTKVANAIESEEIYAIAPLTHDVTVHQMFNTHVQFMSGSEQKGERILFVNPLNPTRAVDNLLASGIDGNTTATQNQFVMDVNPDAALAAAGLNPAALAVTDNVFLELTVATGSTSEVRRYNVSSVNGVLATLNVTFATTENTDGFFTVTPLTETLVNATWSLSVRGVPLVLTGTTIPDKNAIATTVALAASANKQRRMYYVFPDTCEATVNGVDSILPGYYMCAAIAGMVAAQPPQQGFTNLPMTGFTGVKGSNDTFSNSQLNQMAGGGTYIVVQDAAGAPLTCRHQLSTDLTSIETRELSITKVIDFAAKFLRTGLRNFIGTFNITQPFLDTLSTVIQGMLGFLVENGILLGGDLNNLIQSKDEPDTVLVDVTLDVPFPCNYIRLTLTI